MGARGTYHNEVDAERNEDVEINIGENIPLQTNSGLSSLGALGGAGGQTGGALGAGVPNWNEYTMVRGIDVSSELRVPYEPKQVDAHQQEMVDRVHTLAFKAGLVPVEFLKAPAGIKAFMCSDHRPSS